MSELPKFHTFREACEALYNGRQIRRFGSENAYFQYGSFIAHSYWGGSAGTCMENVHAHSVEFTVDEQNSTNWIIEDNLWGRRAEARAASKQAQIDAPKLTDSAGNAPRDISVALK